MTPSRRSSEGRLPRFKVALVFVAPSASADLIERFKGFLEGSSSAESVYTILTEEARALFIALRRARRVVARNGRKETFVEVNGIGYRLDQAEARLDVLRTMQRAALEDSIDDEKRHADGAAGSVAEADARRAELDHEVDRDEQQSFAWTAEMRAPRKT